MNMKRGRLSEEKNIGNKTIRLQVPVVLFTENNIHYAYMPSMDLIGYGNNEKEAQDSLGVVFDEFIRYTINKNTFLLELKRLGWKIKSKKEPMQAPQMSDLINTNEQLRDIVNSRQYTTSSYQVNIPAFA